MSLTSYRAAPPRVTEFPAPRQAGSETVPARKRRSIRFQWLPEKATRAWPTGAAMYQRFSALERGKTAAFEDFVTGKRLFSLGNLYPETALARWRAKAEVCGQNHPVNPGRDRRQWGRIPRFSGAQLRSMVRCFRIAWE